MTEISYPPPFSPKIIQHAVWLYCAHVELSRRRGTARRAGARHLYETVRCWVLKFELSVTSASRISAYVHTPDSPFSDMNVGEVVEGLNRSRGNL
jgi:transposase-like protein